MVARKAAAPRKAPRKRAAPSPKAARFGERGERLWSTTYGLVVGERGLVLLEEACRIADRLDLLHRLLIGKADLWCSIAEGRDGDLEVRVDGALMEARQQANVLRQILTSLPIEGGDDDGDQDAWLTKLQRM